MKQLSIVCGIGLFSLVLIPSFQTRPTTNRQNDCYVCVTDHFNSLTAKEFEDGIKRYKRFRADIINEVVLKGSKTDALSCWYSIDTLKTFICLMEKYARGHHIPSDSLGIRFHYSVYPDSKPDYPIYGRLHTLYLAATINKNNSNVDFDPRYLDSITPADTAPSDSLLVKSYISNIFQFHPGHHIFALPLSYPATLTAASPSPISGTGNISIMSRNQGQLCPNYPNCPTN